jgi:hypothetical protein
MTRPLNTTEKAQLRAMIARTGREEVSQYVKPYVELHVKGGMAYLPEEWGNDNPCAVDVSIVDHDVETISD